MTENQRQPEQRHIAALRQMEKAEAGTDVRINLADKEECEDCGWSEDGRLTDKGRRILAEAADPN